VNKFIAMLSVTVFVLGTAGCAENPNREAVGGLTGAVVGGVVGHQIGEGKGKDLATIAGAIIGAAVGSNIGRSLDRQDELRAQQALETNRTGEMSQWTNPDTGAQVAVVPTRTYENPYGQYCREYQTEVTVGGKVEKAYGTACRQPDGSWKIVQ